MGGEICIVPIFLPLWENSWIVKCFGCLSTALWIHLVEFTGENVGNFVDRYLWLGVEVTSTYKRNRERKGGLACSRGMSNEEQMAKKTSQGQGAGAIEISLDKLNDNERAVLGALAEGEGMKIREIVYRLGWNLCACGGCKSDGGATPCYNKGNSRVRNSLRRLVRGGFVLHGKNIGDGRYRAASGVAEPVGPSPVPVTEEQRLALLADYNVSKEIKQTDCTFYNACLDQAISGKWDGFACTNCTAYSAPDRFQQEMDGVRLQAMLYQAENLLRTGKTGRKRGVKPGADAKRTHRKPVVIEEDAPLVEALAID
jgi:hypothetical protein